MEKYIIEYYLKCTKEANDKEDAKRLLKDQFSRDSDYKDARIIHLVEVPLTDDK